MFHNATVGIRRVNHNMRRTTYGGRHHGSVQCCEARLASLPVTGASARPSTACLEYKPCLTCSNLELFIGDRLSSLSPNRNTATVVSLKVYNFCFSLADRIIWLCEELTEVIQDFKYELVIFPRGMLESEGKQKLLSLHPSNTSPNMIDETISPPVTMTESQAILEYIRPFTAKVIFNCSLPPVPTPIRSCCIGGRSPIAASKRTQVP